MSKPYELTDEEFKELVTQIAKPSFNFLIKRVNKEILSENKFKSLDLNHFINVLVAAQTSVDANLLRWIQAFHKIKTNSEIDFATLKSAYIDRINEHLKLLLQ